MTGGHTACNMWDYSTSWILIPHPTQFWGGFHAGESSVLSYPSLPLLSKQET